LYSYTIQALQTLCQHYQNWYLAKLGNTKAKYRKDACAYGIYLIGTQKYDRIDIQSKVFGGANCIPTLYRLLKNSANITRTDS